MTAAGYWSIVSSTAAAALATWVRSHRAAQYHHPPARIICSAAHRRSGKYPNASRSHYPNPSAPWRNRFHRAHTGNRRILPRPIAGHARRASTTVWHEVSPSGDRFATAVAVGTTDTDLSSVVHVPKALDLVVSGDVVYGRLTWMRVTPASGAGKRARCSRQPRRRQDRSPATRHPRAIDDVRSARSEGRQYIADFEAALAQLSSI